MTSEVKPLVLVILDGWGVGASVQGNAIARADLANYNSFLAKYPHTILVCAGEGVGLPEGQMGNSEVGHLNMGSGRVVYQDLTRITREIRLGAFFQNEVLLDAINHAKNNDSALHLMGLLSDGGVHSHISHLYALLDLAARENMRNVFIHVFLDGRDVPPANAKEYLTSLEQKLREIGFGAVATVMGRYYGMDRDRRWDRTERAFNAMTCGEGTHTETVLEAVDRGYYRNETDEFIQPTVIINSSGDALGNITSGDAVIFFNFRPDRARQITRAFTDKDFDSFTRKNGYPAVHFTCMTLYDKNIEAPVAFKPQSLKNTLGEVLGKNGIRQLRLAETEKYAHVTFFFNGGVEEPNPLEERILIPSPKVATYDRKPEMSAREVTDSFLDVIREDRFKVIIMNYANSDMVGHTGDMGATIEALEIVDSCVGKVVQAVLDRDGTVLITSDHGNADEMEDSKGCTVTCHTTNPVPFIYINRNVEGVRLREGSLRDIAPTILQLLGIPKPAEMTGSTLITAEE
ncbi:MAG: 2,3-bisphosphoglycerate-independent phosphoglycerate mutase [Desulfotomaculaceae bacterium]|nr:2,3-bisphosphoglycerate-independent phosphoglycerate mutase [Desulfotomaculaceae bacterium]MDD4766355.1 2,3-bisphosphoglycerate-independent phosphoglycerate mutase [Desulfotomaculaceae bacterium]